MSDRVYETDTELRDATAAASSRLRGLPLTPFSRNGRWSLALSVAPNDRGSSCLLLGDLNAAQLIAALDLLRPESVARMLRREARYHAERAKEWAVGDAHHRAGAPAEESRAASYAEWATRLEGGS